MSEPRVISSDRGLVRGIGVRSLTLTSVNLTIGSSIFVLPALAAKDLGVAVLAVYVLCAVAMGLVALCFAEAGSRIASSGGLYAYNEVAFGSFTGFVVGTVFWVGNVVANGAAGVVLVGSIASLLPGLEGTLPRTALLLAIYTLFVAINVRGLGPGVRLVEALTILKLLPLLLVFLAAGLAFHSGNLVAASAQRDMGHFGDAALLVLLAFGGFESALANGGEIRDPRRTVPRALFLVCCGVTLLYCGIQSRARGSWARPCPRSWMRRSPRLFAGPWARPAPVSCWAQPSSAPLHT